MTEDDLTEAMQRRATQLQLIQESMDRDGFINANGIVYRYNEYNVMEVYKGPVEGWAKIPAKWRRTAEYAIMLQRFVERSIETSKGKNNEDQSD